MRFDGTTKTLQVFVVAHFRTLNRLPLCLKMLLMETGGKTDWEERGDAFRAAGGCSGGGSGGISDGPGGSSTGGAGGCSSGGSSGNSGDGSGGLSGGGLGGSLCAFVMTSSIKAIMAMLLNLPAHCAKMCERRRLPARGRVADVAARPGFIGASVNVSGLRRPAVRHLRRWQAPLRSPP